MKKIFTLALGLVLATAMFAADKRPTVTVTSAKKYEIVIDGKPYLSNGNSISISNLFSGTHNLKVYSMKPGFFMRSKKLVSSSIFDVSRSNVQINIDRSGQIEVSQSRFGNDWKSADHSYNHNKRTHDKRF